MAAPEPAIASGPPPPAVEEPLVRVRDVSYAFGEGEARKGVLFNNNLQVMPGELTIMSGPSGSGKTTLLSLVGALRKPQEGSLQILGVELQQLSGAELIRYRQRVGFIFQHHNLFPALTAYQSVRMALDLRDQDPAEKHAATTRILTRLGLEARMHYKPARLSGGQRQRVAIARALVHRPRLLLADEPTAALDKDTSHNVLELFKELVREHRSAIIMVTHDNRLLHVADRIVNMVDGQIASNVRVQEMLEVCGFLKDSGLFTGHTPAELMEIAQKMTYQRPAPGTVIVRQGDEGDRFYLIRGGVVEVDVGGQMVTTLARGQFFGERALIAKEPRSATVRARDGVELYSLGKDDFENALDRSAAFKDQLLSVMFQRT